VFGFYIESTNIFRCYFAIIIFGLFFISITMTGMQPGIVSLLNWSITVGRLFFFFQWFYIPGWDLTPSMSFRHSSLDCALSLQFLHPIRVTSLSNSPHHLNFGLPFLGRLLSVIFWAKFEVLTAVLLRIYVFCEWRYVEWYIRTNLSEKLKGSVFRVVQE
jgi:hypothetical protein